MIRQKVVDRDPIGDIIKRLGTYKGEREVYQELFHAPDAHILAVDDNEVNLTVIKNLLKKTCIDIDTVLSGKEAIAAAREKHYDIAFVDHMMPNMDGIETLSRMKEDDVKAGDDPSRTVYIAMTANAVSGARERYLSAGFEDYISKPVDGRRLEEMIKKYLPKEKILEPDSLDDHAGTIVTEDPDRKILVVDDDEVICSACEEILGDSFKVICCHKGEDVSSVAGREKPDLILLDINLVGMNGFEVLQELKADVALRDIPAMFITADEDREKEVLGLKNGALDFIRKPFIPEVLLQRSKRTIALDRFQKGLKGEVRKQTKRAERLTKEMMLALSHTVDAKDHYTNGHSERVAAYAAEIGRRFGKSPEEQKKLYEIGLLHDIGKIGVPEEIINKTERLTDDEFTRIKEHTLIGCEILKGIKDMPELSDGARHHHERYDGKGYPDGLAGDAIPEVARIICVADCYDAMTSTRTYSDPKSQEKVRAEIVRCSGTQFDPVFADIMLSMIDDDTDFTMNEKGGGQNAWKNREQLWDADDSYDEIQIETDDEEEEHELPQWLTETDQLDYRQGIVNCGSESGFLSVLTTFHQTARTKADEIESLYERGDIENYTIKVHALKSAARIIGATDLSEMARALEAAGKEGNLDTINKDTAELLARYRELDLELNKLDSDNENLPELSDRMRREAFQTISEIAGSMDFGMMEGMLKDLKGYRLKTEDKETVEQIEQMLMQLDWEGITEAVKQVLS